MIRKRSELLAEIQSKPELRAIFTEWEEKAQEDFLDFCCGNKAVKILYDSFFKEILNPEYDSERLEDLLSLLLGEKVRIIKVLPNDSTRIADEASLLIMDIVVELENGSIANVEVQKIGYLFPGERSACYSADLLLRQYKRVRGEKQKKFSYKDIKSVYTIVFFEQSPKEFHEFSKEYLHYFEQKSNTGLELELLQKYLFIPLDIFKKTIHNKPIKNKLDAWLLFFSGEKTEDILRLIEEYPEFRVLYEDVYNLCLNTEKVMEMFSKELRELDRNTVQYMMDEMQDTIDEQKEKIEEQKDKIEAQQDTISEMQEAIDEKENSMNDMRSTIDEQKNMIDELRRMLQAVKET